MVRALLCLAVLGAAGGERPAYFSSSIFLPPSRLRALASAAAPHPGAPPDPHHGAAAPLAAAAAVPPAAAATGGNATEALAVGSERWWGGDDGDDGAATDAERDEKCRGKRIASHANFTDACAFVETFCGGFGEGLFQYVHLRYCVLGGAPSVVTVALLFLWLCLLISLLATTADSFFVPQLETLSGYLDLSPEVAGITLLALGNGAPDVFAARAALTGAASDFPLMLSDLLGASVFISTCVLGAVLLTASRSHGAWSVDGEVFGRDVGVYVAAVLGIFCVASDGSIELWEALLFLAIYVIYIALVVGQARLRKRRPAVGGGVDGAPLLEPAAAKGGRAVMAGIDWATVRGESAAARIQFVVEYPFSLLRWASIPGSDGAWDRRRRVWTAIAPPCVGLALCLDSPWNEANGFDYVGGGPGAYAAGGGALLAVAVWFATDDAAPPTWYPLIVLTAFAATIMWLDLVASELVAVIEALGRMLGISTSILGLTLIAMGNSVGDLVADTATARTISPKMAVASCFGSPLLNDVLGVGVACTVYCAKHGALKSPLNAQDRVAYVFLLTSLLSSAAAFPALGFFDPAKTNARLRKLYPTYLFALYALFALVSCLVEANVIPQARICAVGASASCVRTSS